ncbi:carboxylating nicotinate-nucleotide diphosphorylase [uncultured Helicobacter sp.]|uniref:carboxylating nicotinate-nucleotide diphosphorylase n=1 Tax=uncultured Helicobacter sp. TaxID=175537 RepID=UPI00374E7075
MNVTQFVQEALSEDLGRGDLFALVAEDKDVCAHIVAKESGVFSGQVYIEVLCAIQGIGLELCVRDSQCFESQQILGIVRGSYLKILQTERTLLNLIAHSSGIATHTYAFVQRAGERIKILDTRKTRPLLRLFEKYSVRNGGAHNHRFGLDDALMLKDTHLAFVSDLESTLMRARKLIPWTCKIEVEVEDYAMAQRAFRAGADIVMCDNMSPTEIEQVVTLRDRGYPHIALEASGNITLENITTYAKSGVDALSIGALIHQAKWLDISLKMQH